MFYIENIKSPHLIGDTFPHHLLPQRFALGNHLRWKGFPTPLPKIAETKTSIKSCVFTLYVL